MPYQCWNWALVMSLSPTLATESPGTSELLPPPQAATTSAMTTKKAPSAVNRSLLLTRIARLAMGFARTPHFQELFRRGGARGGADALRCPILRGTVRRRRRGTGPGDWIVERLHGFARDVGSLVPGSFPAYARLLHPALHGMEPD